MLADSANWYGSILTGHPKTVDKSVRIQLSFIRDLRRSLALTFIDEGYNLADSLTKTKNGHRWLLTAFLQSGMFKVGFLGRQMVKKLQSDVKMNICWIGGGLRFLWLFISYFVDCDWLFVIFCGFWDLIMSLKGCAWFLNAFDFPEWITRIMFVNVCVPENETKLFNINLCKVSGRW